MDEEQYGLSSRAKRLLVFEELGRFWNNELINAFMAKLHCYLVYCIPSASNTPKVNIKISLTDLQVC